MDERLKFWLRTAIKSAPGQRQLSNGPMYPPASLPAQNTTCRVPNSPQGRIRSLEGPKNLGWGPLARAWPTIVGSPTEDQGRNWPQSCVFNLSAQAERKPTKRSKLGSFRQKKKKRKY